MLLNCKLTYRLMIDKKRTTHISATRLRLKKQDNEGDTLTLQA